MNESPISRDADPRRIDLKTVVQTLRAGTATDEWFARWLPKTYAEPVLFRDALYAHAGLRRGGIKSVPGRFVDFYHDCVLAHLGQGRRALIVRTGSGDVELGYDDLHARCGALMQAWQREDAKPGQCICILLEFGIEYVVALMTALRMGLVVCALPAWGPTFLRHRVEALAPDYVVGSSRQLADLRSATLEPLAKLKPLAASAPRGSAQGNHAYAPDEAALRSFSAFGSPDLEAIDLPAAALHAALLRDGALVFGLEPTDTLALPGFDPRVMLPSALLTTLLWGATWSEWQVSDFSKDPGLVKTHGLTLLGVGQALAGQILATGKWPPGNLRTWFRSLTCPIDFSTYGALGQLSSKANVASFNLGYCTSVGGVLLAGPPNKDALGLQAWPPAGEEWELGEVGASALIALNDSGVYTPLREGKAAPGGPQLMLTRSGQGYLCAGAVNVGPDATAYPVAEVSQLLEQHPGVRHASVVVTPGTTSNHARITLLVFVEEDASEEQDDGVRAPELSSRIEREMGSRFVPSRVEIFPLRPRLVNDEVDHGWCRSQYLSGALTTKARSELFRLLSRLGTLFDVQAQATG